MKTLTTTLTAGALLGASFGAHAAIMNYGGDFTALNGSGVAGSTLLSYDTDANTLDVSIQASGLEPNMPHAQHIHGTNDGAPLVSQTPTLADDMDGDGFVELGEAAPAYGSILVQLMDSDGNFPTAPDGTIDYERVFDLSDAATFNEDFTLADLLPLEDREVVIHGMTLDAGQGSGPGEADGTAGYKATLPVASAELSAREVPEPGELGLFLIGAGLIGGLTLARRRQAVDLLG